MRHYLLILCTLYAIAANAVDADSLSLKIKNVQLNMFPNYSRTICDNYNLRSCAGLLNIFCSTIQVGDTLYILELQDRLFYEANYTSIWKNHNIDSIFSYSIYKSIDTEKGSSYCEKMIKACISWDKDFLIRSGEEHIRHWTDRAEVILTRIIFITKNVYNIDCLVFFDFDDEAKTALSNQKRSVITRFLELCET